MEEWSHLHSEKMKVTECPLEPEVLPEVFADNSISRESGCFLHNVYISYTYKALIHVKEKESKLRHLL